MRRMSARRPRGPPRIRSGSFVPSDERRQPGELELRNPLQPQKAVDTQPPFSVVPQAGAWVRDSKQSLALSRIHLGPLSTLSRDRRASCTTPLHRGPAWPRSAQRFHPAGDGLSDLVGRIFLYVMAPRDLHLGQRWQPADEGEILVVGEDRTGLGPEEQLWHTAR